MPNDYFQFKQFRIDQGNCGMKITTDACVFGAFVGQHFTKGFNAIIPNRILDIGTGTGLLALMMAQYFPSKIDAVELDKEAYKQSQLNFLNSKWAKNISSYHSPIQEFAKVNSNKTFDLIISNPPFFNDSFKPPSKKRSLARHTDTLKYFELLSIGEKLLSDNGFFYILLPKIESNILVEEVKKTKLKLIDCVQIFPNPSKSAHRMILILSKNRLIIDSNNIYIKNNKNSYSKETLELLQNFYLYL